MPHIYFIWAVGIAAIICLVRLYLSERYKAHNSGEPVDAA
jgi:hypothetical protein